MYLTNFRNTSSTSLKVAEMLVGEVEVGVGGDGEGGGRSASGNSTDASGRSTKLQRAFDIAKFRLIHGHLYVANRCRSCCCHGNS